MYGYVADGYWCDIGQLDTYREAQYDALRGKVKLDWPFPKLAQGSGSGRIPISILVPRSRPQPSSVPIVKSGRG